ncbi:MAG: signal peptide peptidase SppA [Ignavibacteria bacterium]|nr:signal peptide peptidase SppA [Ignavibacteria bacterium]
MEQTISNSPISPEIYKQRRGTRWWIPVIIIGVIALFILLGFLTIASTVGVVFQREQITIKDNSVLVINFGKPVTEYVGESVSSFLSPEKPIAFYDILNALNIASRDDKIRGIYLKTSLSNLGWAKRVEVVEAIEKFRASGKFVYAFIEMGGEADYYLALPAEKIFLPRESALEMNGFSISALFLKGLFDKIGIEYYVQQFEDFKSAGEIFNRNKFSDSARIVYRSILNQRYKTFLAGVKKYRNLEPELVQQVLDRGVYAPDSLLLLGFVDSLLNENQVKEFIRKEVLGEKYKGDTTKNRVSFVSIKDYISSANFEELEDFDKSNAVAVVYASGPIVQRIQKSPFSTDLEVDPDNFIKNLRKARDDKKVKAIIVRIDSPGGSVVASDEIWDEIQKVKKIKPVYASMSDVAASGGYYLAMACDTIIAHPTTITGSIGVIAMVPNYSNLVDKVGITVDTLSTNYSSQDLNLFVPFTQRSKQKLEDFIRPIYFRFIQKVADSRKKSFEETRALAKGRVWTGEEAYERGLVDVLGGLNEAINIAAKRIGVPNPYIKRFPRPTDEFELLIKLLTQRDEENSASSEYLRQLGDLEIKRFIAYLQLFPRKVRQQLLDILNLSFYSRDEHFLMILPDIIIDD